MIKGFVHLKILSLSLSLFSRLQSPRTSYVPLFNKRGKKEKGKGFVAAPSGRQSAESWQQTWTQLIIPRIVRLCACSLSASLCLSSCLSVFLSFSCRVSAFCEGDSVVSQLGLSSLSSDLSRNSVAVPFLASAANTHTHTHTHTLLSFLWKAKLHTGI